MAMPREQRAKQFAPFEALTGLRQALAKKEYEHNKVEKTELSEEALAEIEQTLQKLEIGRKVEVTCYEDGYYIVVVGAVTKINPVHKYIMVEKGKIHFDDLYDIKIV